MKKTLLFLLSSLFLFTLQGQVDHTSIWTDAAPANMRNQTGERWIIPQQYRTLQLDKPTFERLLQRVPSQNSRSNTTLTIAIPLPNGTSQRFAIHTSTVLHPDLAAKYPDIQTYSGIGVDDPSASVYLDMTPQGFHGMVLSPKGTVFIDPYYKGRADYYVSYYKKDFIPIEEVLPSCQVRNVVETETNLAQDESINEPSPVTLGSARMATVNMRTYKIAIGANRQYTAFHGGTVAGGLAAVTTAINRVTGVYENELAVSFQLVANNDQIIFTNASNDPYSNNSNSIDQNAGVLNNAIGNANYDIGHVFTTGSGGLAGLGVVCNTAQKAAGTTGLGSPTGDPFHIDFVAHEIGHQFGGNHTFNGDSGSCAGGNRNRSTAYEPGSGSTIQAYAGICGNDNLQDNSDPYFHLVSLNEMRAHVTVESGANCGTLGSQNNTVPVANANAESINGKNIPANTPFELTGSATDGNGDGLTYSWEQWNLGNQSDINSPASGAPLFRSFEPTISPTRVFPRLQDLLNNTTTIGEELPTGSGTLNFQFIARDDNAAGAYHADMIGLTVVNSTGFKINAPNTATTLSGTTTVTWDVAGTTSSPVSCSQVDIYLSLDGGQTFSQLLADDVTNNGSATITLPNVNVTTARLKVKCADNVFLDINDANFTIEPSAVNPCTITDLEAIATSPCDMGTGRYTQQIEVTYTDEPSTGNLVVNNQSFAITSSPQTVTLTALIADGNTVNTTANFSANSTCTRTENNLFTAPVSCLPVCSITTITAGMQTACVASTNNYTQEVIVTYENKPGSGNLVVNNQTFAITASPQTVILTDLISNGNPVSVTANFSANTGCTNTVANLFQAPASCTPVCAITAITAGTQTACNTTTNGYTQEVIITYVNQPTTGNLVVNNQNFGITGSPQTVTLTNLNANGNAVNVTAHFATDQNCTFTQSNLFTAPAACVTDLCQEYDATDIPIIISASGTPTITSTINVAQAGIITDINIIDLIGQHTFVYDLDISLTSPSGKTVLLVSEACLNNGQEDFDLNVDDNGTATGCPLTGNNTYAPVGSLADFNGEEASGDWVLTVKDFFDEDGGSLEEWTLEICTVAGADNCAISAITAGNQSSCDPNTNTYSQVLVVTYVDPPTTGNLVVNNQNFAISSSPQMVTLTNLPTNGMVNNVTASFSAANICTMTVNNAFTAPSTCEAASCAEINSSDTPKTIPDPFNRVDITSTINVTETKVITDVNVKNLIGTHDYVGDLRIELTSPAGTTVRLITRKCDFDEDFNLNFDDEGSAVTCPLTGGNTFAPKGSLADFNGEMPTGNWVLTVTDFYGVSGGTLDGWTLEICTGGPPTTLPVDDDPVTPGTYIACEFITSLGNVATSTTVLFQAGTSITLSPGFIATAGCNFTAQIVDCTSTLGEEELAVVNKRPSISKRPNIDKQKWRPSTINVDISPNPFSHQTQINYQLPSATDVAIRLIDGNGRLVQQVLPISFQSAGNHQMTLKGSTLPTGIYFLQVQTTAAVLTKKLVIQQ